VYVTQPCGFLHNAVEERTRDVGDSVGLAGDDFVGASVVGVGEGVAVAGSDRDVAATDERMVGCGEGVCGSREGATAGTGAVLVAETST
jgi:hypothetical protein